MTGRTPVRNGQKGCGCGGNKGQGAGPNGGSAPNAIGNAACANNATLGAIRVNVPGGRIKAL